MKSLIFSTYLLLVAGTSQAQVKNLHNFTNLEFPYGSLIKSGSVLYGMTYRGGVNSDGCVFSIKTNGNGFTDLLDFDVANGQYTNGSLLLLGNRLYGLTYRGGANGEGVLFSININGSGYKDIYDFISVTGGFPRSSLTLAGNKFYGTTNSGGANGDGVVFSIDTNGNAYSDKHDFDGTDGSEPYYGALSLSGKTLFGMTFIGGGQMVMVLFSL